MSSTPTTYIIFSTHNGARVLGQALHAYAALDQGISPWRIVAVDNASTDDTRQILRSFESRLPITVLTESVPGKNRALNRAIGSLSLAESDNIVFTDDDAITNADFLSQWQSAFRRHYEVDLFGGTVLPHFPSPPPKWLSGYEAYFDEIYARNERDDGAIEPDRIYGPNMGVRARVLLAGLRFNEEIGPNSTQAQYPMGSETEFCVRAAREGGLRSWFVPGPKVGHIVRPEQMLRSFVLSRAYRHGRGFGLRERMVGADAPSIPIRGTRAVLKNLSRAVKGAVGHPPSLWNTHWMKGYASQFEAPI